MSSPDVNFPDESPEERALQQEQVQLLRQQRDILSEQMRQQQLLAPILFESAGIEPIMDESGKITGFREATDELDPLRQEIEKGFLERTRAALAGELPVNPALLRDLEQEESTLRESLRRQLGPGFEASTPGQEALDTFFERRTGILEGARRADLTLAESLGLARGQSNEARIDQMLARLGGQTGTNLAISQGFGNTAAGYQNPLNLLLAGRQGKFGARALSEQLDQANQQMWLNFGSDLLGGVAMAAAASSARLKKNIEPLDKDEYRGALKKLRETPITRWRYKHEPDDREPHIGPILELSPKEIHYGDGTHVSLLDYSGLLHAGLKGLDREVKTLRQLMEKKGKR